MGTKDICHDGADVIEEERRAEDERGTGHGQRHEGGNGIADAAHRIQGADAAGDIASSGIQDGVQHVLDRGIFPQGDRGYARNQRDNIQDTAQQGKDLAAEQDKGD